MKIDYTKLPKKANPLDVEQIVIFAKNHGYTIVKIDYNTGMIRFRNGGIHVNLYTTSFTVSTEMLHPKKGKTQLHRKGLTIQEAKEVFMNPRVHTGLGYYRKKNGNKETDV